MYMLELLLLGFKGLVKKIRLIISSDLNFT